MWGNIAISFLLAFIVSFMATPYSIKIHKRRKIFMQEKNQYQNLEA